MPKILSVTDFSEHNNAAVHYAAALAMRAGYCLRILHAYVIPIIVGDTITQPVPLITANDMMKVATEQMHNLLSKVQSAFPPLTITTEITYGDWWEAATTGEASTAELIVTGSNSEEGSWLGNDLHDAVVNFEKTVLVLPTGTTYKELRTICLACDAAAMNDMRPVLAILPLLKATGSSLQLLHIHAGAADTASWNKTALAEVLDGISYTFSEEESGADAVDKKIQDFAVASGADWLALIPHHYSFFQGLFHKSHTRAAFRKSDLPVLCLH